MEGINKRRNEQRETIRTAVTQQNGNKSIPINNYFNCKWTKLSS